MPNGDDYKWFRWATAGDSAKHSPPCGGKHAELKDRPKVTGGPNRPDYETPERPVPQGWVRCDFDTATKICHWIGLVTDFYKYDPRFSETYSGGPYFAPTWAVDIVRKVSYPELDDEATKTLLIAVAKVRGSYQSTWKDSQR